MTTTQTPETWSVNRRAAKAIALHSHSADDARRLLDMCGLIDGPEGQTILPDDTRVLPLSLVGAGVPGGSIDAPAPRHDDEYDVVAAAMTTPSGLRNLPPAEPTKAPRKRTTKKAQTSATARTLAAVPTEPRVPASPVEAEPTVVIGRVLAIECDVWFTEAQRSPNRRVQRAAREAASALADFCAAMDELARTQRADAISSSRTTGDLA